MDRRASYSVMQKIDGCKLALEGAHITVLPRMAFAVRPSYDDPELTILRSCFNSSRRKMSPNADVKWQGA